MNGDFPGVADRIRKLRTALKLNQEPFARLLGVKQSAVSAWEQSDSQPSADNYMRLAVLAAKHGLVAEAKWFLKKAKIPLADLALLVPELEISLRRYAEGLFVPPSAAVAEMLALPSLDDSFFQGSPEDLVARLNALGMEELPDSRIFFPRDLVPHLRETVAVRAPDDHMRPLFGKGDFVAIEIRHGMGTGTDVFADLVGEFEYGQIAAVYFTPKEPPSLDDYPSRMHPNGMKAGLNLRYLRAFSGDTDKKVSLESEKSRSSSALRDLLEAHGEKLEAPFFYKHVDITGNPEYSIFGRAIAWLGSAQART